MREMRGMSAWAEGNQRGLLYVNKRDVHNEINTYLEDAE